MAQADGWLDINRLVPRTGRLVTEDNRFVNIAESYSLDIESYNVFNEKRFVQRQIVFSLSSIFPLSVFRDVWTPGVTHNGDEYEIPPGDVLDSARLGVYVPGYSANAGIGFRFNQAAGAEAEWGYFDDNDGFLFRYTTANGLQAVVLRGGTENKVVDMANFTTDPLDGTGPSGLDFVSDPTKFADGYVFEIDFTYYGYGPIIFKIVDKKVNGKVPRAYIVHVESIEQAPSTGNTSLPVRAKNIGSTGSCFVTGRQYSIIGEYNSPRRATGKSTGVVNVNASSGDWSHIISFRRKAGQDIYSLLADNVSLINLEAQPLEYQLVLNSSLSGGSVVAPENRSVGETAVEFLTGAVTIDTMGEQFFSDIVVASGSGRTSGANAKEKISKEVPRDYWVSLIARSLTTTATSVYANLRAEEQW